MGTALFATDTINTEPNPDTVQPWYNVPDKSQQGNEQCCNTDGDTVWLFYQLD